MGRVHRLMAYLAVAALPAAAGAAPGPVLAQPAAEDCDTSAWPLASARIRLAVPERTVEAGGRLVLPLDGAVMLSASAAPLPYRPTRQAGRPGAGFARIAVPPPGGVFQITVSETAWLDVFSGDEPLSPIAFTGVHACPGVRKSLRFRLPAGEVTLLVTDVAGPDIRVVIDRATP